MTYQVGMVDSKMGPLDISLLSSWCQFHERSSSTPNPRRCYQYLEYEHLTVSQQTPAKENHKYVNDFWNKPCGKICVTLLEVTRSVYRLNQGMLVVARRGASCGLAGPTAGFSSRTRNTGQLWLHLAAPNLGGGGKGGESHTTSQSLVLHLNSGNTPCFTSLQWWFNRTTHLKLSAQCMVASKNVSCKQ